jgi:hypothetical protein
MKRLLILFILISLAGCSATVEDVAEEPVIIESEESLFENNDLVDDDVILDEKIETESPMETIEFVYEKIDSISLWQKVFENESNYFDFRFMGCKNLLDNSEVRCQKYNYDFAQNIYFDNMIYFKDQDEIQLIQQGNPMLNRDDDLLQVIFVGELVGLLPPVLRKQIDIIKIERNTSLKYSSGVLTLPLSYQYEDNASYLRQIFLALYWALEIRPDVESITELVNHNISKEYDRQLGQNKVLEIVLWYYFQPLLESVDLAEENTLSKLNVYFDDNGFDFGFVNQTVDFETYSITLPNHKTLYVNSAREELFNDTDPSALDEIIYKGIEDRNVVDRRLGEPTYGRVDQEYYIFDIIFIDGTEMEFLVNKEIDFEEAEKIVYEVSLLHGQLPTFLRTNFNFIALQPGYANVGILRYGYSFHLDYYKQGLNNGSMKHFLIHEVGHISLDWEQALPFDEAGGEYGYLQQEYNPIDGERWIEAQKKDEGFLTMYSEENPLVRLTDQGFMNGSEDVADTLVFYIAITMSADRFHPELINLWKNIAGNRFEILDEFDFTPPPRGRLSN